MVCRSWSLPAGIEASGRCTVQLLAETENPTKTCSICADPVRPPGGSGCTGFAIKVLPGGYRVPSSPDPGVYVRTWTRILRVSFNLPADTVAYFKPWWQPTGPLGGTAILACHPQYNGDFDVFAVNGICDGWASREQTLYSTTCTPYSGTPRVDVAFPTSGVDGYIVIRMVWRDLDTLTFKRAIFRKFFVANTAHCRRTYSMTEWRHDDSGVGTYSPLPIGSSVTISPVILE